jgi:hypothetical protein
MHTLSVQIGVIKKGQRQNICLRTADSVLFRISDAYTLTTGEFLISPAKGHHFAVLSHTPG